VELQRRSGQLLDDAVEQLGGRASQVFSAFLYFRSEVLQMCAHDLLKDIFSVFFRGRCDVNHSEQGHEPGVDWVVTTSWGSHGSNILRVNDVSEL